MNNDSLEELTLQQQAFVDHYLVHFNACAAALAAGYSPKSIGSQASQILGKPKVKKAILDAMKGFAADNEILKMRVVNQLQNLAFSDIRDYITFSGEHVCIKDSEKLTREQAAAIVEVKAQTIHKDDCSYTTVTFKLAQKEKSLELLSKHLGLHIDQSPVTINIPGSSLPAKMSFSEFCINAGYPAPYPKQDEMREFGLYGGDDARMILGSRGYGKTDYVVILGVGYEIYSNPMNCKKLLLTKSAARNAAILDEIGTACEKAGVIFEIRNAKVLRVAGLQGKDHSIEALTLKSSSLRGHHPEQVIMDDPVTPEDSSEATRSLVKKIYSEACKLTSNILLIGQPVHKYDLYEELRPKLRKMEVPHGTIPELDIDIEAMKIAGVDEASISASYHLKILSEGTTPFDKIRFIKEMPKGDTFAFIDPAFEGIDYTAITIIRAYFEGVAVVGFCWKKSWNHCLDDINVQLKRFNVRKLVFETNSLGDQPIEVLRGVFGNVGVSGRKSNTNKHSRIMSAGTFAHMIHLSEQSHPDYISQVTKYEYKAKNDDCPDSLASALMVLGLIRGKE